MTTEEWRAAVAAARPPLTQAQITVLRPILRPAISAMRNAAPATTGAAPAASPRKEHADVPR